MSWRDRDYSRVGHGADERRPASSRLPPPACLSLVLLHTGAFIAQWATDGRLGAGLAMSDAHSAAWTILIHPYVTTNAISLGLFAFVCWTLAARLEERWGAIRLILLYLTGNVVAAIVFLGYVWVFKIAPSLILAAPFGALAAWCGAGWRGMRADYVMIGSRLTLISSAVGYGALIVVGGVVFFIGADSAAWLAAVVAAGMTGVFADALRISALGDRLGALLRRVRSGRHSTDRPSRSRRPVSSARSGTTGATQNSSAPGSTSPGEIDDILSKIRREGVASLTESERERLENVRRSMLNDDGPTAVS